MNNPVEKRNLLRAIEEKMESMKKRKTWELVEPPVEKIVIGCKWSFKNKYISIGEADDWFIKDSCKKCSSDYDEILLPVIYCTTI